MALQNVGCMFWPTLWGPSGDASSLGHSTNSMAMDSASDRLAYIGRAPKTDGLTHVNFRLNTVTTGCDLDIRVETVSNGRPTGTLWDTNTNIVVTVAGTDDNIWKTATLTATASMNAGDEFAIVIVVSSGTPNLNIQGMPSNSGAAPCDVGHYPIVLQDTGGGTWVRPGTGNQIALVLEWGAGDIVYLPGLVPHGGNGVSIVTFSSGSAPNERALRFQVTFKCRVSGLKAMLVNPTAAGQITLSLWDGDVASDTDAEALAQATLDCDFATAGTQDGYVTLYFVTPVEISPNTTYYIGMRADNANSVTSVQMVCTLSGSRAALPSVNAQTYLATRTWTAGAADDWVTDDTIIPMMHLVIDQLDDGASSGGGGLRVIGS